MVSPVASPISTTDAFDAGAAWTLIECSGMGRLRLLVRRGAGRSASLDDGVSSVLAGENAG